MWAPTTGGKTLTTFYAILHIFASMRPPLYRWAVKITEKPTTWTTYTLNSRLHSIILKLQERRTTRFAWTSHSPRNGAATVACFIMVPSRKIWRVANGVQLRAWLPRLHCHSYDMQRIWQVFGQLTYAMDGAANHKVRVRLTTTT
jgi:hypothetical protein